MEGSWHIWCQFVKEHNATIAQLKHIWDWCWCNKRNVFLWTSVLFKKNKLETLLYSVISSAFILYIDIYLMLLGRGDYTGPLWVVFLLSFNNYLQSMASLFCSSALSLSFFFLFLVVLTLIGVIKPWFVPVKVAKFSGATFSKNQQVYFLKVRDLC